MYKGYRCLDLTTSRIYVSRHARFDENVFPFIDSTKPSSLTNLEISTFLDHSHTFLSKPSTPITPIQPTNLENSSPCKLCSENTTPNSNPSPPQSPTSTHTSSSTTDSYSSPPSPFSQHSVTSSSTVPIPPPPPPPISTHPMITRAKAGIFKPRHFVDFSTLTHQPLHNALLASSDPKTVQTALKQPQWVEAMQRELDALHKNNTWSLVPRPLNRQVVGSKWLFRTKFHSDSTIERHKARLVAQGYSQTPGLDYSHTFSPVVKSTTIRIILSLAVLNKWTLHQLDVNNAFLHGQLKECLFMEQPPGFVDPQRPNHVCKLNKALYDLKQAPRAWFHRLSTFLISNGFSCSRADTSLFIFKRGECIMYLLVYVDDLILT